MTIDSQYVLGPILRIYQHGCYLEDSNRKNRIRGSLSTWHLHVRNEPQPACLDLEHIIRIISVQINLKDPVGL